MEFDDIPEDGLSLEELLKAIQGKDKTNFGGKITPKKGPYSDLNTRMLVLQEMDWGFSHNEIRIDLDNIHNFSYTRLRSSTAIVKEKINPEQIIERLNKKEKVFRHTSEYYAALKDKDDRMRAYKSLTVSGIVDEKEQEIEKNPLKFLGLSEDADWSQVRSTYITLTKIYHPDIQNPFEKKQRELIFGKLPQLSFDNITSLDKWVEETQKFEPPQLLDEESLEALTLKERDEYEKKHNEYRKKEDQFELIKSDMRARATEKMKIITKAYSAAKKLYSKQNVESFSGFNWSDQVDEFDFSLGFLFKHKYKSLKIEGPGEIIKEDEDMLSKGAILAFDYGNKYMEGRGYRQYLPLKEFFAWTEIVLGKELSPLLIKDLVEHYNLGIDKAEQLRLMIMNDETPDFIIKTLEIPINEKINSYPLKWFTTNISKGPMYSHLIGPRGDFFFPLGVEFYNNGGMSLRYMSQEEECFSGYSKEKSDYFSPSDLKIMASLAYGPMLQ